MIEPMKYALVVLVGYLLGSLNFSIIVSKAILKKDIRKYGSGNAGSTNAFRMMGAKLTVLVMLGDIAKGVLAALFAMWMFPELGTIGSYSVMLAGFAVVIGHSFPLYFKFQGGKGILSTAAVWILIDWRCILIAFVVFLIIVLITRFVSFGSISGALVLPITVYVFHPGEWLMLATMIVWSIMVIILHRGNIQRLLAGTEKKFSFKRKPEGEAQ